MQAVNYYFKNLSITWNNFKLFWQIWWRICYNDKSEAASNLEKILNDDQTLYSSFWIRPCLSIFVCDVLLYQLLHSRPCFKSPYSNCKIHYVIQQKTPLCSLQEIRIRFFYCATHSLLYTISVRFKLWSVIIITL